MQTAAAGSETHKSTSYSEVSLLASTEIKWPAESSGSNSGVDASHNLPTMSVLFRHTAA